MHFDYFSAFKLINCDLIDFKINVYIMYVCAMCAVYINAHIFCIYFLYIFSPHLYYINTKIYFGFNCD